MEAMGTGDRLAAATLIARLLSNPHGFDLFQAIHLLERSQPWARALGHGDGTGEALRFSGHVSLAFEPGDIRSVRRYALPRRAAAHAAPDGSNAKRDADAGHVAAPPAPQADTDRATYTVTTAALTLAGANGPLPLAFTELVLARRAVREAAMADLLDIFNHRFLSFLYRSRVKHSPGLNGRAPDDAALAACLDALGNLGLRDGERGPGDARLWLRHAGLLGGAPRSLTGLLALLSDRLGVRVRGAQFVGGWRAVDARDTLWLAREGGRAPRLGGLVVVGRRCWDQAAGIRIEFLDLAPARFASLLPGGDAHALAAWLIRCYLQQDLDVHIVLRPASPLAACTVGGASAARLGWTAWLAGARRAAASRSPATGTGAARLAPVQFILRAATSVASMQYT